MRNQSICISAVIITYNEARNIGRCLDSLVDVVDDIVVLDSYSTDHTVDICKEKGARVYQHPFLNYSDQKNRANALALYDWVFSIDADEAIGSELTNSILDIKKNGPDASGYEMSRLTNYCGQWIWHSGWYPDRKTRLFDRNKWLWGGPNPHEILIPSADATLSRLAGDLHHYSYYSIEEHLGRARHYATLATEAMQREGKRGTWIQIAFSPLFKFFRNYVLKLGFLDGKMGFVICRIAALETYWKYRGLMR